MASRCDSSGEIGGREEKSMRRLSLAGRKRWRVLCCPALAGVLMVWASAYLGVSGLIYTLCQPITNISIYFNGIRVELGLTGDIVI